MRFWLLLLTICAAIPAQDARQRPKFDPNWPCTGKEPSFDPSYAKVAEATGGQVFLFDRSEVARSAVLMAGASQHPETIIRSAGRLETQSFEIRVPVDSTVESLFVSVTLQCMERIALLDPQGKEADPLQIRGEDTWLRAGRISEIPQPQPGAWRLRLTGGGPYFVSVRAKTRIGLHGARFGDSLPRFGAEQKLNLALTFAIPNVEFGLVSPTGDPLQPLVLDPDPNQSNHWTGLVIPSFRQFRVSVTGTDEQGFPFQRTDPRLFEAR